MQVYRLTKCVEGSLLAKAVHQSLLHGLTGTFASELPPTVSSHPEPLAVLTAISTWVNESP